MSTEAADAVVIGAGHNGLVAANMLADAGWSVLVLEATDRPGGAVQTAEVTEPGFHVDLFSSFYPLGAVSPAIRGLGLEGHGLRWRHAPDVLAHVLPDDRCAVLSRDLDRTAASADEFAPGDGDAWRALAAQWKELREPLLAALFAPFPPVRPALKLLRRTGTADALRLARMLTLAGAPVRRGGVRGGGRAAAAGRKRRAQRRFRGQRGQRRVRLVAGDDRAGHRVPGPRGRRGGADGGFGAPPGVPGWESPLWTSGARGHRRRMGGHWACATPRATRSGRTARCSPTSRHRSCTASWSARSGCRPGWSTTCAGSSGTARR